MSSHSALPSPSAVADQEPPPPPSSTPRARADRSLPTTARADLTKDVGAVLMFLISLGSTFWVTEYSTRSILEEWPMAVLAGLTALGVVVSSVLCRFMPRPTPAVHLIRLVPAGLLIAAALIYLLAVALGLQGWTTPGFGNGYLLVLALGLVAALPRSGDPVTQRPSLWAWLGLAIVGILAVAHLLLPVYAEAWEMNELRLGGILASLLLLAVVPLVSLWAPLQGLRPGLRVMGLTVLLFKILSAFNEGPAWFAGPFLGTFGLDEAILFAGLLALGMPAERQAGRRFARAAAVLCLAVAVALPLLRLAAARGAWESINTSTYWALAGAGLAAIVFLALQGSRRRAQVFPALAVTAVLFVVSIQQGFFSLLSGDVDVVAVVLSVLALLLITTVRLDRDPGFDILPVALQQRYATEPGKLETLTARAYQHSAIVLSVISVVTGPLGILFGMFAFHRAREAESAGLLTTASRIIAGLGITLGIASFLVLPAWLSALGTF